MSDAKFNLRSAKASKKKNKKNKELPGYIDMHPENVADRPA